MHQCILEPVDTHLVEVLRRKELFWIAQIIAMPAIVDPVFLTVCNMQTEEVTDLLYKMIGALKTLMNSVHP